MAKKKPKPEPEENPLEPLRPGECRRLYCLSCSTEFEITLEPKVVNSDTTDIPAQAALCCPFCGDEYLEDA